MWLDSDSGKWLGWLLGGLKGGRLDQGKEEGWDRGRWVDVH